MGRERHHVSPLLPELVDAVLHGLAIGAVRAGGIHGLEGRALDTEADVLSRDRLPGGGVQITLAEIDGNLQGRLPRGLVARLLVYFKVQQASGDALSLKGALYAPLASSGLAPQDASLAFALLFNLAMFAAAWALWRKGWFIKA